MPSFAVAIFWFDCKHASPLLNRRRYSWLRAAIQSSLGNGGNLIK
jgi:hypothetical protein